jgi:hypothetical protein
MYVNLYIDTAITLPGRETNHLHPTSDKVKKMWIYTSTPPQVFMAWCLIN